MTAGARLANRNPRIDLALLLLGHDEAGIAPHLQNLSRSEGVEERAYFAGFRQPIEHWIAGMDVLMATSEREPFGRTLIEAMAVGTPVVASRVAGHVEIIDHEHTGLLVSPGDPDAFATAAHRILTDPALAATLAEEGRARALERYSVERHVRQVVSIYDCLSSRSAFDDQTHSRVAS